MNPNSDPRVFFAAERTQLAWVRTGLPIMALGFVVTLPLQDLPARYSRGFAVGLSLAVAVLGLALAAYLALGPH